MQRIKRLPDLRATQDKRGFTLVEMLVSTALVLLMMVLFAQVFKQATDSMTRMKGMAENDQKARQLTILLRGDLQNRTFKNLKPFRFQTTQVNRDDNRLGYFSISENKVTDSSDDVLQFTAKVGVGDLPFAGRTNLIRDPADTNNGDGTITVNSDGSGDIVDFATYFARKRNQPEFDDGQATANGTGSSQFAEVCYFLRNGNLYRRVLLIREPYDRSSPDVVRDGFDYPQLNLDGSGFFWRDFEYSAFHNGRDGMGNTIGMTFHSIQDGALDNTNTTPPGASGFPTSLGIPHFRFGSTVFVGNGNTVNPNGFPREFLKEPDSSLTPPRTEPEQFIGRYTSQETAHSSFRYPGEFIAAANPFDPSTNRNLDSGTGLVTEYSTAETPSRRGEDVLMSNVHEFDIKVWDEDAPEVDGGRWVDIGHAGSSGRYRSAGRRTSRFGDFRDNRYDTWHPSIGSVASPFPPFFSATNGLDGVPGSAADGLMFNGDDDGNGISDDETELGWAGSDDEVQALTAMKITIRYYDVSSNQMRQLTLVQSLLK